MDTNRSIGWFLLLLFGLLCIWASITGAGADLIASIITPAFLERTDT
jgi:hypothetical protein